VGPLEWNAALDPHAADIVYRAPVPLHRSIGLDVTARVQMDAQQVRERFQAPLLRPVLDFAEVWFSGNATHTTFHDPLAATTIFNDDICVFERGTVDIETDSKRLRGFTHFIPDHASGKHEIAVEVDADRFFKYYFEVF
jgi:inosine-uridine nucleoside N-ribohydrolase